MFLFPKSFAKEELNKSKTSDTADTDNRADEDKAKAVISSSSTSENISTIQGSFENIALKLIVNNLIYYCPQMLEKLFFDSPRIHCSSVTCVVAYFVSLDISGIILSNQNTLSFNIDNQHQVLRSSLVYLVLIN